MDELKIPFLTVFAWLIFHSSPIFRTVEKYRKLSNYSVSGAFALEETGITLVLHFYQKGLLQRQLMICFK